MKKALCAAAIATAFLSSAAHSDSAKKKAPPPQKEEAKPKPKTPTKDELDALLKSTDDIAKTVSKLRGLPVKSTIVRSIMGRDDITKRILLRMGEDQTETELKAEERVYKRLGLLDANADYKQIAVDLLTEQIAGFFDPDVKQLYLADWIAVDEQRMVMAHEIDHALQDQSFDLIKFMKTDKDNSDAQLARQALVEGDGVALMIEFMAGERMGAAANIGQIWDSDSIVDLMGSAATTASAGDKFDKAPLFMRDSLMFPYLSGLRFVAKHRKGKAWTTIDAIFAKPPASTEQIIHPDKYDAGEAPVVVKLAAKKLSSLKGFAQTYTNTVGELMFTVLLKQHGVSEDDAKKAAAGWGGDTLIAVAPAKKDDKAIDSQIVIDVSSWDTEADATEAFAALGKALLPLSGTASADAKDAKDKGDYLSATDSGGRVYFTERKGKRVSLVIGAPAKLAGKLRADLLK